MTTGSCGPASGLQVIASGPYPTSAATMCPSLASTVALKTGQEDGQYYPKVCGSTGIASAATSPWWGPGAGGTNAGPPLLEVTFLYSCGLAALIALACTAVLVAVIGKSVFARMRHLKVKG